MTTLGLAALLSFLPAGKVLFWTGNAGWGGGGVTGAATRVAAPAVAAVLLVALILLMGRRRAQRGALLGLLALAVWMMLVAPDASQYRAWVQSNAPTIRAQNGGLDLGLALRRVTLPTDRIALSSAGAIAYFSGRPAVDLLGVNDARIAHQPPATTDFVPGHTKWDYAYSIDTFTPAIVYAPYGNIAQAQRILRTRGYQPASIHFSTPGASNIRYGLLVYLSPAYRRRIVSQQPSLLRDFNRAGVWFRLWRWNEVVDQ